MTNELRPTWTWAASLPEYTLFQYQLDSQAGAWTETTDTSWTPGVDLSEGPHILYVQEWQTTMWSPSGSWTITADVTAPNAPVVSGPAATNNTQPTWT